MGAEIVVCALQHGHLSPMVLGLHMVWPCVSEAKFCDSTPARPEPFPPLPRARNLV